MSSLQAHLLFALAWLSFGLGHSLLASGSIKHRLHPLLGRWYRLAFNGFAILHLGLVWTVGWWAFAPHAAFPYPVWAGWTLDGLYVVGALFFLYALTEYDLGRFAGIRQIREPHLPEDEPLRIDGLHRLVRHPLYAGGLLVIWGRVSNEFELTTAIWATLYLAVGAFFEERRLLRLYGPVYADYRDRVPAVVPWKGRVPKG